MELFVISLGNLIFFIFYFRGNNSKYGMILTMSWSIFGVILLSITYLIKTRKIKSIPSLELSFHNQDPNHEEEDNQEEEIISQN
jgi:hypothetical protein